MKRRRAWIPVLILVAALALGVRSLRLNARYGKYVEDGQRAAEALLLTNPPPELTEHLGKLVKIKGSGFSVSTLEWRIIGFFYLRLERVGVFSRGTHPLNILVMANEDTIPGRTNIRSGFGNQFDSNRPTTIFISHPSLFKPER